MPWKRNPVVGRSRGCGPNYKAHCRRVPLRVNFPATPLHRTEAYLLSYVDKTRVATMDVVYVGHCIRWTSSFILFLQNISFISARLRYSSERVISVLVSISGRVLDNSFTSSWEKFGVSRLFAMLQELLGGGRASWNLPSMNDEHHPCVLVACCLKVEVTDKSAMIRVSFSSGAASEDLARKLRGVTVKIKRVKLHAFVRVSHTSVCSG